jgi:hypothetical protein
MNDPTEPTGSAAGSDPHDPSSVPVLYTVTFSGRVLDGIRELISRAGAKGRGSQVRSALVELNRRLQVYPQVGEPLRDLAFTGNQLWHCTVPPLVAIYVIDDVRRQVVVAAPILTLPNSGIDDDE